jgi:ABC-type multidrug transport system ATPase subunit
VAVDDVSLSVSGGEIFGVLGPNGAGKPMTVGCALGLRRPDGAIRGLGLDPGSQGAELHQLVHDSLGLAAKRDACYRSLSGGRKQRRAIALGGGCAASGNRQERSDGHRYQHGFHSAISCSYTRPQSSARRTGIS